MAGLFFSYPWALALLPLAAIPPLLHLLKRRRSQRVPFPSLMLLKDARTLVWRRYRLEELLLLAVRTLLVLALVAMLAQPMARLRLPGWLAGASQKAVVILDDSASMAAVQDGEARFLIGRRLAERALEDMGPKSLVAVVSGGQGNRVLAGFQRPALAMGAIRDASPKETATDLDDALSLADRMLAQSGGPAGRILLISDFQRTGFGRADRQLGRLRSKAQVALLPVNGGSAPANLAWESVEAYPMQRRLVVRGRWPSPQPCLVALERAGRPLYRARAQADAGGRFVLGFGLPGQDSLYLKIANDALDLDDVRYLSGQPPAPACLLVADDGDPGAALLYKGLAALRQAGSQLQRRQSPTAKDLGQANVIILAGKLMPGALQKGAADAARAGAGLLLVPPLDADRGQYNQLLERLGLDAKLIGPATADAGQFRLTARPGPLIQGLEPRDLGVVRIDRYWRTRSGSAPAMSIDGYPGMLFLTGVKGSAVLWLVGVQPQMSDLGYHTAFPVLLANAVRLMAGYGLPGLYEVGDVLQAPSGRRIDLLGPGGSPVREAPTSAAGRRSWVLDRPGWYLLVGDRGSQAVAVNLPARESDLEPVGQDGLRTLFSEMSWETVADGRLGAGPGHQPLWRAILLFGLVLLAAEGWLRMRLTRRKNHLTSTV